MATGSVKVVNCTFGDLKGLSAVAEIYNMDGSMFARKSAALDCSANSVQECLQLFAGGDKVENLSDVHFIRLVLTDGNGKPLSNNFYWRGKMEWKYDHLRNMQPAQITGVVGEIQDGHLTANIENRSPGIALMTRLKVVDVATGLLVAPVFYSDNYFSLIGHESRRVEIRFNARRPTRAAALVVEGWNVAPLELGRVRV